MYISSIVQQKLNTYFRNIHDFIEKPKKFQEIVRIYNIYKQKVNRSNESYVKKYKKIKIN